MILRHDVDEASYRELGRQYADVLCGMPPGDGEGTLISPSWVLTAAHVAIGFDPGDAVTVDGQEVSVGEVILHPEFRREQVACGVAEREADNDVALVKLARPVAPRRPVHLYPQGDEARSVTVFVGRGQRGTGLTGPVGNDGTLRGATNRVEQAEGGLLYWRFDDPRQGRATELEGVCGPGDSGGPALLERDGRLWIIGVSSSQDDSATDGQSGLYGVTELYARVSAYLEWINETVATG